RARSIVCGRPVNSTFSSELGAGRTAPGCTSTTGDVGTSGVSDDARSSGGRFRDWGDRRVAGSGRRSGTGAAIRPSNPNAPSARSSSDLPFSGWPGTGILLCSVISAAPSRDKPTLDELDAQQHDEQDPESARSRGELLE